MYLYIYIIEREALLYGKEFKKNMQIILQYTINTTSTCGGGGEGFLLIAGREIYI